MSDSTTATASAAAGEKRAHESASTERRVPDVQFYTRVRNEALGGDNPFEWKIVSSADVFAGQKVVLFALPGAFTPTCSSTHLPGYAAKAAELKALGVDRVICLSVNDAFTMFQWSKKLEVDGEAVYMLPDGNGDFSRLMGMLVKKENLGFGLRSWRYSMYVEDGRIIQQFVEPGLSDNCPDDPFEVSDVDTMLEFLRARKK